MDKMNKKYKVFPLPFLTLFIIISIVANADTLKCYRCDGKECVANGTAGDVEECTGEKPICAQYIDLTGEPTGKVGTVFKRYCGEGSSDDKSYCKCIAPNWDICTCATELCNAKLPNCVIRNFGRFGEDVGCRK